MQVEVAHQGVADGEQQPVGGGEGRRQPARGHQPGDHVGQPAQLRRGQHDEVGAEPDLAELHDAVAIDVLHGQQGRIDPRPLPDPARKRVEAAAHEVLHDLELDQHREGRCAQVEQRDEEQRPRDRSARGRGRRHGVVAREQVRQAGGADHEAEHQCQEVAARYLVGLALRGRAFRVARIGQAVRRQAAERAGTLPGLAHLARPEFARGLGVARQQGQFAAGSHHEGDVGMRVAQPVHALARRFALPLQCRGHIAQPLLQFMRAALVRGDHLALGGRLQQLRLQRGDLADLPAIDRGRERVAQLLVRQPRHGDQEGQQDDHVLCHLRPGDGAHAAQEGAQQHAPQAQHDADLELHAREPRGDQAHAVDLRHHVGEGAQHGRQRRDHARPAPAEAHLEEFGNRVEVHRAQVRRDEQRDEAEAPRPAQQVGEPPGLPRPAREALQVERPREADERGRAHPVGRSRHAVVERRNAPARDVVFLRVGGAAVDPDGRIDHHREEQEDRPDPLPRQAPALGPGHEGQEGQHAHGVERQQAVQAPVSRAAGVPVSHGSVARRPRPGLRPPQPPPERPHARSGPSPRNRPPRWR